MEPFRRLAFFTVARDAAFVALAAATLMLGFSFAPALAFLIGANVALMFCLGLTFRALRLDRDADRVTRAEPWRVLDADERPDGESGRLWARDLLEDRWLRAAKAAALVAVVLAGASLVVSASGSRAADITVLAGAADGAGPPGTNPWPRRLMQVH